MVLPKSKATCKSSKIEEMQYCVTNHIDLGKEHFTKYNAEITC